VLWKVRSKAPTVTASVSKMVVATGEGYTTIRDSTRVGAAGDNAAMESFFALLQKNVLNRRRWQSFDQLRLAIVSWIERTYHRRRRQARLGKLTPVEFEMVQSVQAAAAA
jgi:hypothetical protein